MPAELEIQNKRVQEAKTYSTDESGIRQNGIDSSRVMLSIVGEEVNI